MASGSTNSIDVNLFQSRNVVHSANNHGFDLEFSLGETEYLKDKELLWLPEPAFRVSFPPPDKGKGATIPVRRNFDMDVDFMSDALLQQFHDLYGVRLRPKNFTHYDHIDLLIAASYEPLMYGKHGVFYMSMSEIFDEPEHSLDSMTKILDVINSEDKIPVALSSGRVHVIKEKNYWKLLFPYFLDWVEVKWPGILTNSKTEDSVECTPWAIELLYSKFNQDAGIDFPLYHKSIYLENFFFSKKAFEREFFPSSNLDTTVGDFFEKKEEDKEEKKSSGYILTPKGYTYVRDGKTFINVPQEVSKIHTIDSTIYPEDEFLTVDWELFLESMIYGIVGDPNNMNRVFNPFPNGCRVVFYEGQVISGISISGEDVFNSELIHDMVYEPEENNLRIEVKKFEDLDALYDIMMSIGIKSIAVTYAGKEEEETVSEIIL